MIFAQLQTADPVHVWNFLLIVSFFLSAGSSAVAIWGNRRIQKREVQISDRVVTSEFCRDQHQQVKEELNIHRIEKRNEVAVLHDKVEAVARDVAAIDRNIDLINQGLTQVNLKLDRSIERAIRREA